MPLPPSNLTTPIYQNSHTGGTPLIALTPAESFPNAASSRGLTTPPLYSQVIEGDSGALQTTELSDQMSSGVYATVGGSATDGSRHGRGMSPSEGGYSNSTALGLGNNIQLSGAESANQTDV